MNTGSNFFWNSTARMPLDVDRKQAMGWFVILGYKPICWFNCYCQQWTKEELMDWKHMKGRAVGYPPAECTSVCDLETILILKLKPASCWKEFCMHNWLLLAPAMIQILYSRYFEGQYTTLQSKHNQMITCTSVSQKLKGGKQYARKTTLKTWM